MKTIHIRGYDQKGWPLKYLYKEFLVNDPLWHFVYWEDFWTHKAFIEGKNLIIRISDKTILKEVRDFLKDTPEIEFEEYDFPFCCRKKYLLGLLRESWEAKHLDIALPMLHMISVAYMKLGGKKRFRKFASRYFHLIFNIGGFDHMDEVIFLSECLRGRLGLVKAIYRGRGNKKKNRKKKT